MKVQTSRLLHDVTGNCYRGFEGDNFLHIQGQVVQITFHGYLDLKRMGHASQK